MVLLRKLLFAIILFSSFYSISQEELLTFKNSLKTSLSNIKDVIPIINEENGDLSIFIADAKNIYGYRFDSIFTNKAKVSFPDKKRKYTELIGRSIIDSNNYRIFLTNRNHEKFSSIRFSFNNSNNFFNEFKLVDSNEEFIQTVTYKNKFYLITAALELEPYTFLEEDMLSESKKSLPKGFYIYTFDKNGNPKRNVIDLSQLELVNKSGNVRSLPNLLLDFVYGQSSITKIKDNLPNSIEAVSVDKKMYSRDDKIIFTFDINESITQVVEINLETLEAILKRFKKPIMDFNENFKKTNSFINGNKLFTITATTKKFVLHVNDFEKNTLLKELSFTKYDTINFKNTPIIIEGVDFKKYREVVGAKKFLRKISGGQIGISAFRINNKYHLTIGGYVINQQGGMMPMSSFGGLNDFSNSTMFAYNSILKTKSTRIECLFDDNFNHLEGEIEDNAFNKIKEFEDNYKKDNTPTLQDDNNDLFDFDHADENDRINNTDYLEENARVIFKYKDYYILGNYNGGTKQYTLRKFED